MRDEIDLDSVSVQTATPLAEMIQTAPQPAREAALTALVGAAPILVLTPHPNAETLGCGALLAACFAEQGASVVCVGDGRRSHRNSADWPGALLAELRMSEMRDAVIRLGGRPDDLVSLGFEDGRAPLIGPDFDFAVETVIRLCEARGVESLFAPTDAAPYSSAEATLAIAREVIARRPGMRLFLYASWSRWTDQGAMQPTQNLAFRRFPSGDWAEAKRSALFAHRSQLGLVVNDDDDGFTLPDAVAERALAEDEIFFEQRVEPTTAD